MLANLYSPRRARSLLRTISVGALSMLAALLCTAAEQEQPIKQAAVALRDGDRLLVVDCLLPGQIRRLGNRVTYLSPRRPAKTSAEECAIRGGEYVAYDRSDIKTALNVWLPLAQEGNKEAQTYVGEIYEKGLGGGTPDYAAAANWYAKAAAQSYPRALINLGFLHEKGLGVTKDPVAALNFYRKASGMEGLIGLDDGSGASLSTRDEEIKTLRKELDETRKQLEKAKQDLETQKGATQQELERLKQEKAAAQEQGNQETVKQLEAQLSLREGDLEKQRQQVSRLEKSEAAYREQLRKIEGESAGLRAELSELRQQVENAAKELELRKAQAADGQKKLDAVRVELEQQQRAAATSADERGKTQKLEIDLKQREEELARQRDEIKRLEESSKRYQEEVKKLEALRSAAEAKQKEERAVVAMAPPSIQLIDPPVVTMRSPLTVKVRGNIAMREIIGRVTAPAGLLAFTINDVSQSVATDGMFKSQVQLQKTATPVSLVAVDRQGKRALLDFSLVPDGAVPETHAGKPLVPKLEFGNYHALVIGNQKYQRLPSLDTAVEDADAVADLLTKKYNFKVSTLTNATRYQILSELNRLRQKLTDKDNLLIYYAGHGELDQANLRGHWLPVDAEPDSDANWISSVAITDILNAMAAKHALIVADSCYSGSMTRGSIGQLESGMSDEARTKWLEVLAKNRARVVLTSGGVQPVMDGGGGKHSVFAKSFLEVLENNQDALEAQRLYREVAARVLEVSTRLGLEQKPEYAPLKFAGHEAGDFLFVPKN